jgi:mannose-6-phosphate isomerase-like protein (cupin superfamily)
MNVRIVDPKIIEASGNKPKQIAEYIGKVASGHAELSIAKMVSPSGWVEPAQTPEFDEYSVVLHGELHVILAGRTEIVRAGQAVIVPKGMRVQYATPGPDGAEYVAVCVPGFAPNLVHREAAS